MIIAQHDSRTEHFPRVLVGVCTYNEAENVQSLLSRIVDAVPAADVLVIDDDSPDGTAELVRQFAAERAADASARPADPPAADPPAADTLTNQQTGPQRSVDTGSVRVRVRTGQRGLGSAIRMAMQYAVEEGYDLFCNLDADLSHDPADLPRLIAEAAGRSGGTEQTSSSPRVDVVIGSRYVRGGKIVGWPPYRRWMSGCLNRFTRRLLQLPVRDASGSFRCYQVDVLADLPPSHTSSNGYAFLQEVLMDLHRAGATCVEVPITFIDREAGQSKLGWREATRSAATVVKMLRQRSARSAKTS